MDSCSIPCQHATSDIDAQDDVTDSRTGGVMFHDFNRKSGKFWYPWYKAILIQ